MAGPFLISICLRFVEFVFWTITDEKCMSSATTEPRSVLGAQGMNVVWTYNDFLSEQCHRNTQSERSAPKESNTVCARNTKQRPHC